MTIFTGIIPQAVKELFFLFDSENFELSIVGGWVRDAMMGNYGSPDIDLTTNARPEKIAEIVKDWADDVWTVGAAFGTVSMKKGDTLIEITTYRADSYDEGSRKPGVKFGNSLVGDLARRDFTINAMAIKLPNEIVDPFGGMEDLKSKILRTPRGSFSSITDDPLRIYRAARFMSKYDLTPDYFLLEAIKSCKNRLSIVSEERKSAELTKLMELDNPVPGLKMLDECGVFAYANTRALEWLLLIEDAPSLRLRFASILTDLTHDEAGAMLRKMRFTKKFSYDVAKILKYYNQVFWTRTDQEIRKLIMECGTYLDDILSLAVATSYFDIPKLERILEISKTEDLSMPFSGKEIMEMLGISSGPDIGAAFDEMRRVIAYFGPVEKSHMTDHLRDWYSSYHAD